MSFRVQKADGTLEFFNVEKLRRSLRRAGATQPEILEVVAEVETRLFDGIRTQEIYRLAFELLRNTEAPAATRYSLRRALFGLGPTGFPFEQFLGRLFAADGYTTQTGIIIQGNCAAHEIDIAAYKEGHSFVGEAKFHSRPGVKTDLQVAMYAYARLLDLKDARICSDDVCGIREFWLITNTKFTTTAEKYGACVGIPLLSWDYPRKNNLHDRIQRAGTYPITVLHLLSSNQITTLISHGCILVRDIVEKPHLLRHLHLTPRKMESVLAEAQSIIASPRINP